MKEPPNIWPPLTHSESFFTSTKNSCRVLSFPFSPCCCRLPSFSPYFAVLVLSHYLSLSFLSGHFLSFPAPSLSPFFFFLSFLSFFLFLSYDLPTPPSLLLLFCLFPSFLSFRSNNLSSSSLFPSLSLTSFFSSSSLFTSHYPIFSFPSSYLLLVPFSPTIFSPSFFSSPTPFSSLPLPSPSSPPWSSTSSSDASRLLMK